MLTARWLRDERVIAALVQLVVAVVVIGLGAWLAMGVVSDMRARGLAPGLGFLGQTAGFGIGEGPAFRSTDSYGRALVVGLANTLRVAIAGIVLATGLGFVVSLARLSRNPLLVGLSRAYVDALRNTPVSIQLLLWIGLLRTLPPIGRAVTLGAAPTAEASSRAWVLVSLKGAAIAWPARLPGTSGWVAVLAGLIGAGYVLRRWRSAVRERTGASTRHLRWQAGLATIGVVIAWAAFGSPFAWDLPRVDGPFRYAGGYVATPEFAALLFGLVVYTGAFIAEVVRSGIQSVGAGQREAARALGLHDGDVLRLVVLPQALRVMIPPLTNQYLNLAKNSSLAIVIGYPDLFSIGQTVGNQTGQFVAVVGIVMLIYLSISVVTSIVLNAYGRHVRLVER